MAPFRKMGRFSEPSRPHLDLQDPSLFPHPPTATTACSGPNPSGFPPPKFVPLAPTAGWAEANGATPVGAWNYWVIPLLKVRHWPSSGGGQKRSGRCVFVVGNTAFPCSFWEEEGGKMFIQFAVARILWSFSRGRRWMGG